MKPIEVIRRADGVIQKQTITSDWRRLNEGEQIRVKLRFDDDCDNGSESFSITADIRDAATLSITGCGCCHDDIAKAFPKLAHLIQWHGFFIDGRFSWISNAVYHAGDRDCWGLRKNELHQIRDGKTGNPCWQLIAVDEAGESVESWNLPKHAQGEQPPSSKFTMEWRPWYRVGEGKERDFKLARKSAVWPEATDEELSADNLREVLEARAPAVIEAFKQAMRDIGFEVRNVK